MHQGQFPDCRWVRSGDHRAKLFGDKGHRLRHQRSPGPGQDEGKNGVSLRRYDR
jgi:hypothetical protein